MADGSRRGTLKEAVDRDRQFDLEGSSALYQRLLIEHPAWALEKKVDTRLLSLWRRAMEQNHSLIDAAKIVHQQIYVRAEDERVKCLAISSIGDLERYAHHTNEARQLYQQAITICPSMGKCYNQVAVLDAQERGSDSLLRSVYGHLRALWAAKPFPPARNNLLHAFSLNRAAMDAAQTTLPQRWNCLIIRIVEIAFTSGDEDDQGEDPAPFLAELSAISRSLALSQNSTSLPNMPETLVILLGLSTELAWGALAIVFGWQMTSLAVTAMPRRDLVLAVFCICACRRTDLLTSGSGLLTHLSRLANTLSLDGIEATSSAKPPETEESLILSMFRGFEPIESIPGWDTVLEKDIWRQPDFLAQSVRTLGKLTMQYDPASNRFSGPVDAPLVVLDVPNICMKHGKDRSFSCKGLALAVHYFRARGLRVHAFVPENCIDYEKVANLKRLGRLEGWSTKASAMPDDVGLLRVHYATGTIIATPQGDYDDSYTIEHARRNSGIVISNDRFRDASQKQAVALESRVLAAWIRSNVCSFAFAGDQFIPNPDFVWPPEHDRLVKLAG
ncbi:RNase NYN domain-containing protein [Plasmodiophora brassicae]